MNNLAMNNEREILDRIKAVRGNAEPNEPTEELIAVEVKPDEAETIEEVEAPAETVTEEAEPVELAAAEEPEDNTEELFLDLDGEEVNLNTVRDWKNGSMMQADYTRKTQALADERKTFEAEKLSFSDKTTQLDEAITGLQVHVDSFSDTEIDGMSLEELRDIDPGQYLKVTEQQAKRKQALKDAKGVKASQSDADMKASAKVNLNEVVANNPQWLKDDKKTKAFDDDMAMVNTYLDGLGYTEATKAGILTSGQGQVFLDAARFHANKSSNASIKKKVRKVPVITRPGGASKSVATKALETARENHKRLGTPQTALALRKAQKL